MFPTRQPNKCQCASNDWLNSDETQKIKSKQSNLQSVEAKVKCSTAPETLLFSLFAEALLLLQGFLFCLCLLPFGLCLFLFSFLLSLDASTDYQNSLKCPMSQLCAFSIYRKCVSITALGPQAQVLSVEHQTQATDNAANVELNTL